VDKAEREQVEKILAENYELLRKEKILQQGDKTNEEPIDVSYYFRFACSLNFWFEVLHLKLFLKIKGVPAH